MALTEQELLDYACGQFESGAYDAALEAFVLAYTKEYEQEWILENIYNCYMAGNEAEFQKTFECWNTQKQVEYGACTLDFIPYREGEYYIYDKGIKEFRGTFSMDSVMNVKRLEDFQQAEFSALAAAVDWDWSRLPEVLAEAKYRKVYVVCRDMNRCVSFFKIPELAEYASNIMVFSCMEAFQGYFHEYTSEYLPKLCIGTDEEKQALLEIMDQEHAYRLTPEGRNTDNVLLTIGIPTHDRGNLLLKRLEHLRQMPYDAEIEFAVSKNGIHYYQEEYRAASKIADARINYAGYDKELTMTQNWRNVVKIAHGRYVLLVSDEDDVIIPAIEHYLKLLNTHTGLGLVRSRTIFQYNSFCSESAYYQKGNDAFFAGLFSGNYLSGTIYNREIFMATDLAFWEENYSKNEFYYPYPHVWWQAVLAFAGDYAVDAVYFIREGDSVLQEEKQKYIKDGVDLAKGYETEVLELAAVSTYESRIKQFRGAAELIWNFNRLNMAMKAAALYLLVNKTIYLMDMVYDGYSYKVESYPEELNRLMDEVLAVMEEWKFEPEWKKKILSVMQDYSMALAAKESKT